MILAHRARAERKPWLPARAIAMQRAFDGVGEPGRFVLGEGEAVAARVSVNVAHGVREPADRANYRDRAVAERDQLAEAARLEPRRHEEHVRARIDALCERRIETEREGKPPLHLLGELAPALLVGGVPGSKHDELATLVEEPRSHRGEQIDALLLDEPSDHTEDRRARLHGETGLRLQRRLADGLATLVVCGVVRGDMRVARGIEERRIEPIWDAPEIAASAAQKTLESLPELGREDLLRITLAHRRDDVRGRDGPRHRV